MKTFFQLFIISSVFTLFSCEKEGSVPPEPMIEVRENGRMFSYNANAGFKDREFQITLSSQDAEYHSVDIFLEDLKEETFLFGFNTFNEVRIGDFNYSTDVASPNSGYLTVEKINWQDSTFDAVFAFELQGVNGLFGGGKWEDGVLRNVPFSNMGGADKKLCRLSMKIDGVLYAFRCPHCFWEVNDTSLFVNPLPFASGHEFLLLVRSPLDVGVFDFEDFQSYDLDLQFPNEIPGSRSSPKNVEGDIYILKNDPMDFEALFGFTAEYEDATYRFSDGRITIE